MKHLTIVFLFSFLILNPFSSLDSSADGVTESGEIPKTTFLFYISADAPNLYSEYFFFDHLMEMFDKKKNPKAVNYNAIIFFDPNAATDYAEIDVFKAGVKLKEFSKQFAINPLTKGAKEIPVDMGDQANFEMFLNLVHEAKLESEQTILVLDGHGSAWQGVGFDTDEGKLGHKKDQDPPSYLSIKELIEGIQKTRPFSEGKSKLDAVIFNACIMGSIEIMLEFEPIVDYYFSSSQLVPIVGSDYLTFKTDDELLKYKPKFPDWKDLSKFEWLSRLRMLYYPNYQKFNINLNFLKQGRRLSTEQILEEVLNSRVIVQRVTENKLSVNSLQPNHPLYNRITQPPYQIERMENNEKVLYSIAKENYHYVQLEKLTSIIDTIKTHLVGGLIQLTNEKKMELFRPSVLFHDFDHPLAKGLIDFKDFITFLMNNSKAKAYFEHSVLDTLLKELDKVTHSLSDELVSFHSLFLPSLPLIQGKGEWIEEKTYEELLEEQGALKFNEQTGWNNFIKIYQEAHTQLTQDTRNVPENEFLDGIIY